jgi:membrane-associated HD superfamily phosphohydrolase
LEENSSFSHFWKTFRQHAKQNTTSFMIIALSFLAVLAIAFFDVASKETIVSFQLQEFELGQISDRTITSSKNIGPTIEHPITVEKNEKIIKKGFPITEEGYEKLQKLAASPTYLTTGHLQMLLFFMYFLQHLRFFYFQAKFVAKKWIQRSRFF